MVPITHVIFGVLCAWLTLAVEALVVLWANHAQLTSVWEVQFGLLFLAPSALAIGAVGGVLGGLGTLLVPATERRHGVRLAVTAVGGLAGAALGYGVGGGRHFAAGGLRAGLALLVAVLAAAAIHLLLPPLARLVRHRPHWAAILAVCGVVGAELANRWVLVRLYPAFHLALLVLALVASGGFAWAVFPAEDASSQGRGIRRVAGGITIVVTIASGVLVVPGAKRLARFDNFRFILVEQAPLLGQVVRWSSSLVPRAAVTTADVDEVLGAQGKSSGFSLIGRDILLLSVDALRADHVGAYGYARRTTPNIDRLAAEGVRFQYAYAPTPHTSYSITSLMTGKYMRPLLLQGAGLDSLTWPVYLQRYGYRTAAFYPPAVFFIDAARFEPFRQSGLGFEYRKVEFAEGPTRLAQVESYLAEQKTNAPLFVWVHSFLPHEPYEKREGFDFGDRDVERYDSEIALADETLGKLVQLFRARSPHGLVIVTADHGEEFGDHGGRYHGTTVYEEQVRVPLVLHAPDLLSPRVIREPVQTINLLPTILSGLDVPRPPRLRGRDLSSMMLAEHQDGDGLALAETEEQLLLAQGMMRLVCQRQIGACRLFNLEEDPAEREDVSASHGERFRSMQRLVQQLSASHGEYETQGLRAEGKGWPNAILRGVAGDADAAEELALLLDDADTRIRRKSAELLFELARPSTAESLVLSLGRDEDPEVRAWLALALTRLGKGAPLVYDLFASDNPSWQRLSALALAESGDRRGIPVLIAWWKGDPGRSYDRSRQLLSALSHVRAKNAVPFLLHDLDDVRLRPHIAISVAEIGEKAAIGPLISAFAHERYQSTRVALAEALTRLGAQEELARPLVRFLGVPDPLPGGLLYATKAKVLQYVGGPEPRLQAKLTKDAQNGVVVTLVIPKGGNGVGLRAILRATNTGTEGGEVRLAPASRSRMAYSGNTIKVHKQDIGKKEELDASRVVVFSLPPQSGPIELAVAVPAALGFAPGHSVEVTVLATSSVRVEAVAIVPLADEIPPLNHSRGSPQWESGSGFRLPPTR